jgi:hypothetical protein
LSHHKRLDSKAPSPAAGTIDAGQAPLKTFRSLSFCRDRGIIPEE